MKSLRTKIFVLIALCIGSYTYASSVVILMAQHDAQKDAVRETTYMLENGIMDILFEGGYIVSSLPSNVNLRIEANFKQSLSLAKEGYMSHVVFINVNYYENGTRYDETVTLDDIESIDYYIVRTSDSSTIFEKEGLEPSKIEGETDVMAIKRFSSELGAEIKSILDRGEK